MSSHSELPNLIIRSDGGKSIGLGHLMRSLAVASQWVRLGGRAAHLGVCDNTDTLRLMKSHGVKHYSGGLNRLKTVAAPGAWVLCDGYHFKTADYAKIKKMGFKLAVIDDLAHLKRYGVDVLINYHASAHSLPYHCVEPVLKLFGPQYALLRQEFLKSKPGPKRAQARRILVTMGGSDPANFTQEVIKALSLLKTRGCKVVAALGPSNPYLDSVRQAAHDCAIPVKVVQNPDMPSLMRWADISVSAAGTTSWELAYMNVPSLYVILGKNQEIVAEGIRASGAGLVLGEHSRLTPQILAHQIDALLENVSLRDRLRRCSKRWIDGLGAFRIASLMMGSGDRQFLSRHGKLRPARRGDLRPLWEAANDRAVRRNSFHPQAISLKDHSRWFEKKISSKKSKIFVWELGGALVAQIRYDAAQDGAAEIDYSVAPAYRGMGLGSKIIELTCKPALKQMGLKKARGIVFSSNTASIKAFERAGYAKVGSQKIKGHECFIFEKSFSLN